MEEILIWQPVSRRRILADKVYRILSRIRIFAAAALHMAGASLYMAGAEGAVGFVTDHSARAAFLIDNYGNSILRVAYSYLHNMTDAEDILQDTLVQYIKTRPLLESPAHEKAWLLRVAANLSKNKIDYKKVREADELMEELVAEEEEDLAFVWEAVKSLPDNNREVIHLFYHEGYSTAEIASILGRKEATIRSDLKRGRDRLKKILKEAYDFE
ncbi:RNA polymerase sigma factor [Butyrivibrio sp. MC2013]|uniref:RNA polymerase sigma factor n=1 Tax=Butyrivibrio sp. MC2013 TaxID=1280686 RepID=UPI000427C897|nr:sigma-70 family RNA polymerase sigma factor [Butyrivibrio sp. MC2013]